MTDSVTDFYDRLGPEYRDNIGWDWVATMRDEGSELSRFLASRLDHSEPCSVLDCSCGIGTQAIGLALEGHRVHASDLSAVSLECARREAANLGANMEFSVADYRKLGEVISDTFDVVITCDNSIAHCLADDDLDAALSSMNARLKSDGLLLISLRDYDALVTDKPRFNNEHVHDRPDGRRVVFQLWDWLGSGQSYRNNQFLIRKTSDGYEVKHFATELRAIRRDEILKAIGRAGFVDLSWHLPASSGYYQPIVTARKR